MKLVLVGVCMVLGCYGPKFGDCEVSCAASNTCPDGLHCDQGACRVSGATAACPGRDAGGICGNSIVEPGEECDDGNMVDTDDCVDCKWARCGDHHLRLGIEECDDGNSIDTDGCTNDCVQCASSSQVAFGGHCYWITSGGEPSNNMACGQTDHVVTYGSSAEEATVWTALHGANTFLWIGLENPSGVNASGFTWQTGESDTYRHWAAGQPATTDAAPVCVGHQQNGEWEALGCSHSNTVICEHEGWSIRPMSGHAYRVFYWPLAYTDAKNFCATYSAHLVTITDAGEQAFVASIAHVDVYLGLTGSGGGFSWDTGESFTYSNWQGSPPIQPCARLLGSTTAQWLGGDCTTPSAYVCEND